MTYLLPAHASYILGLLRETMRSAYRALTLSLPPLLFLRLFVVLSRRLGSATLFSSPTPSIHLAAQSSRLPSTTFVFGSGACQDAFCRRTIFAIGLFPEGLACSLPVIATTASSVTTSYYAALFTEGLPSLRARP